LAVGRWQLEEMHEVLSQGETVNELLANLKDALNLILEHRTEEKEGC